MMNDDERWMRLAMETAMRGIDAGQTPFGACVVRDGALVSVAHNQVWADIDATAHAEVLAIRRACLRLNTITLSGCVLYSTCEPCPMCFSACHWARISRIVYGATIDDARQAGFNELRIQAVVMKELGHSATIVEGGVLASEAKDLFRRWLEMRTGRAY